MININADNFQKNLNIYLNQTIEHNDIINVVTDTGNAVLLSEEDYRGLIETLYLLNIPGMKERLLEGISITSDECEQFEW